MIFVIILLLALYIVGFFTRAIGDAIHLLLVGALCLIVYQVLTGRYRDG